VLTGYHAGGVTFKMSFGGYTRMTLLSYFAIYVIWGSTFLAIRLAVGSMPPLLMMGVRCAVAGLVLLGVAGLRREWPAARDWKPGLAAGALMFGVPYAALGWAEVRIASGVAALLVATLPFWLIVIEWAGGRRPSARTLAGLGIGLGGVVLLVADGLSAPASVLPMAAIVVGELAWAAGSVYVQPRLPRSLLLNAGMPLTAGGVVLLLGSASIGELRGFDAQNVTLASWLALGYLVVFGSILAFSAYMFLLRRAPASRVSTHTYVNPIIAVALGALVVNEPIDASIVMASLVIASGVALVLGARHGGRDGVPSGHAQSRFAFQPSQASCADRRADARVRRRRLRQAARRRRLPRHLGDRRRAVDHA
jgi:drug/metabolite transporter (DMT)-like permease